MPIPKVPKDGWESREQLEEAYGKWGWVKTLEFEWIHYHHAMASPVVVRFLVEADKLTCGCGAREGFVLLMPTGVYFSCAGCRKTAGPQPSNLFKEIGRRRAPLKEVYEILKETKQIPPSGLPKMRERFDPLRKIR